MRLFVLLASLGSTLLAAGTALLAGSVRAPVALPGWLGLPTLWAGSAGILLSAAYLAALVQRDPGAYFLGARASGRWIWRYVQVPYLVAAIPIVLVSRYLTREALLDQVAERLHVGGVPLPWDGRGIRGRGIDAVLNLCLEFGDYAELSATAEVAYRREGWLDGTAPTLAQLDRAASWIAEHHRAGRTVYVHCAQGHGRSGLAAAAAMIELGLAASPEEARERIRSARPGVRLHGEQARCLDRWFAARPAHGSSSEVPSNSVQSNRTAAS